MTTTIGKSGRAYPGAKRGPKPTGAARVPVGIRVPPEMRDAVRAAAEREGIDESEWWRRAAQERLDAERDVEP